MAYDIIGTISSIKPVEQRTEKFRTREIILVIEKTFKKEDRSFPVSFVAFNRMCDQFDSSDIREAVKYGMNVRISFDLNGRAWTNQSGEEKIFNSLVISKYEILGNGSRPATPPQQEQSAFTSPVSQYESMAAPAAQQVDISTTIDDLPF